MSAISRPTFVSGANRAIESRDAGDVHIALRDFWTADRKDRRGPAWAKHPGWLAVLEAVGPYLEERKVQSNETLAKWSEEGLEPINFIGHLERCASRFMAKEKDGAVEGVHPLGCGDTVLCPLCGKYYANTMSRDAIALLDTLIDTAPQVAALGLAYFGSGLTFTVEKEVSWEIDFLSDDAQAKVLNGLRSAQNRIIQDAVRREHKAQGLVEPDNVGGYSVVHHWGSAKPWEPHYHFHAYVTPFGVVNEPDSWGNPKTVVPVVTPWSKATLAYMRKRWLTAIRRILRPHGIAESAQKVVVHREYLDTREKFYHFVVYQMRSPLQDFWQGVRANVDGSYEYGHVDKKSGGWKSQELTLAQAEQVVARAQRIKRILGKRVGWYGFLANSVIADYLRDLGLTNEDVEDKMETDKESGDKPVVLVPVGAYADGIVLKSRATGFEYRVPWEKVSKHPRPGPGQPRIGQKRPRWALSSTWRTDIRVA